MMIDNIDINYAEIKKKMKPCPFCGGKILVSTYTYDSFDNETDMDLRCGKCGTTFHMFGSDHGVAKSALELWNTRSEK